MIAFGCDHGGRLMIVVIFACDVTRQPRDDHLGPREPDESNNLFENVPVTPCLERPEHVLPGSVGRSDEPDVHYSVRGQRSPSFDLANHTQRRRLFVPGVIAASVPACAVDHSDSFMLIEDGSRKIARDRGLVVGMRDDQQYVGLVAFVWWKESRRLLRVNWRRREQQPEDQKRRTRFHDR